MGIPNLDFAARVSLALAAAIAMTGGTQAQQLANVAHLKVAPRATAAVSKTSTTALVQLYVRMTDAPLAAVAGNKRTGLKLTGDQQRAYVAQLAQKQATLASQVSMLGGRTLAQLNKATNALVVEVAANQAPVISRLPGVAEVLAVGEFKLDLTATVPYIGATAVQQLGVDGTGVRVAVLDSGVDFMHYNLGGTGSVADFNTCYAQNAVAPSGICANFYGPAAPKVIGGYDFVGETWAGSGPLAPDSNPIARAVTGGHGTNVADIILGKSADGAWKGVAPGAKLLAVKVCSAISSSCSGTAILQGIDWALDPNGDNDMSDAVDIINMSLGASYGQRENPSVYSTNLASQFGVTVVVSAGNSANRPFITGSPSTATSAISVAQTQIPSATAVPLIVSAPVSIARTIAGTNTVSWATGSFAGNVRATAASPASPPANDGCNVLPAGSLTGFVAIVRRGSCSISDKVTQAANAGAVGIIVDNNTPGDPPSFSQGVPIAGGALIPTIVLSLSDGNLLRARLAALDVVTVATGSPLAAVGSLAATSSRGPNMGLGMLKPDIGAPGASTSAQVGTGNGNSVFGGTSGAAPMVAGSAALLLQQNPGLLPHEVKARLMNAAETAITTYAGPPSAGNPLAPLSRIGGGEVRVNRSLALTTAAWDASDPRAVSLSMGVTRNAGNTVYRKRVLVRNYGNTARTYTITPGFRYTNDQASGALTFSAPATISVPGNGSSTFILTATLNANLLPNWASTGVNGGTTGGDASLLDLPEYDGFVTIADGTDTVRLPWHILPHQAHNAAAPAAAVLGGNASANLPLSNAGGSVTAAGDVFYLTGTSPLLPPQPLPFEGSGIAVSDLRAAGVRAVDIGGGAFGVQFAVNLFNPASHPAYPRRISVFIDADANGTDDFEVFTQEAAGFASDGRTVAFVRKIASTSGSGFFFLDADLASGNAILTIPMVATLAGTGPTLALTPDTTFRFRVQVSDNYFTGLITDSIPAMQINLNNPRFFPTSFGPLAVPANGASSVTINRNAPGDAVSTSQSGLLLMYRDGRFGREADLVTVTP